MGSNLPRLTVHFVYQMSSTVRKMLETSVKQSSRLFTRKKNVDELFLRARKLQLTDNGMQPDIRNGKYLANYRPKAQS